RQGIVQCRYSNAPKVWMAGLEPAVSGFRRRRISQALPHPEQKKPGVPGHLACEGFLPRTGCHNRSGYTGSVQASRPASSVSRRRLQLVIPVTVIFASSARAATLTTTWAGIRCTCARRSEPPEVQGKPWTEQGQEMRVDQRHGLVEEVHRYLEELPSLVDP